MTVSVFRVRNRLCFIVYSFILPGKTFCFLPSAYCLTKHPSHFGPGNLADGKETDRSEDDQNEAQGSGLVHRTSDVEIKNSNGQHFLPGYAEEEYTSTF